jgi:hypothetical protein
LFTPERYVAKFFTTLSLTKKDLEELVKTMKADYAAINNKLSKLDSLVKDMADLKKLLADSQARNAELHTQLRKGTLMPTL